MPQHSIEHIVAVFHEEGLTDAAPHNLGLAAYCRDPREYARALKACQPSEPTRLRVLTMSPDQGEPIAPPCTRDAMICTCPEHEAERLASIKRGRRDVRQPWDVQRHRAA